MSRYRLLSYVSSQLWAIRPDFGASIASVLARHSDGVRLADAEVRAAIDGAVAARHGDAAAVLGRAPVRLYDPDADEWYTRPAAGSDPRPFDLRGHAGGGRRKMAVLD